MTTTKTCTKCGTTKPLTEFYKHRATGVLHSMLSICKSCYDAGQTAHHHTNKPKSKTQPSTDHLPAWTPLKPSDLPKPVLLPGALDHEKYGSLQPDGSVRPYTNTVHGCVGFLKDTTSNARG